MARAGCVAGLAGIVTFFGTMLALTSPAMVVFVFQL
jgi:hypothetical protein